MGAGVASYAVSLAGTSKKGSRKSSGVSSSSSGGLGLRALGGATLAAGGVVAHNYFSGGSYDEDVGARARSIGAATGLNPEIAYAIIMTESSGNPCAIAFNGDNFVGHINDEEKIKEAENAGFTDQQDQAFTGGDISRRTGSGYDAYSKAKEIDPEAAIKALAMGRYQVLGINVYDDYGSAAAIESAFTSNCDKFSEDVFISWWADNGSLVNRVNRGDIAALTNRYYGRPDADYEASIAGYRDSYLENNQ